MKQGGLLINAFAIRGYGEFTVAGLATAYNTGHKRRSLRSLGLRQIFTSAIATVKTSYAPGTLAASVKRHDTADIDTKKSNKF